MMNSTRVHHFVPQFCINKYVAANRGFGYVRTCVLSIRFH